MKTYKFKVWSIPYDHKTIKSLNYVGSINIQTILEIEKAKNIAFTKLNEIFPNKKNSWIIKLVKVRIKN